jgi:hypothetical protein
VKIETDEEKWAGGAGGIRLRQGYGATSRHDRLARFGLVSAAINGISREKAPAVAKLPPSQSYGATRWHGKQKAHRQRGFLVARGRDYRFIRGFSRMASRPLDIL